MESNDDIQKLRQELATLQAEHRKIISERNFLKRAADKLNFFNNAHDGIVFTDANGNVFYANPYFLEMLEIERKTVLYKPLPDSIWHNAQDREQLFADVKANGFVREREICFHKKNGKPIFTTCSAVANYDSNGNFVGAEIMLCNITGKRQAQIDLMEQSALLEAILQNSSDPMLMLNSENKVVKVNKTLQILSNRAINSSVTDFLVQAGIEAVALHQVQERLMKGETFRQTITLYEKPYMLQSVHLKGNSISWIWTLREA